MKKIQYLGYYDIPENGDEARGYAPAAADKMSYICSALNRAGWAVEIVSASRTAGKKDCPGHSFRIADASKTESRWK